MASGEAEIVHFGASGARTYLIFHRIFALSVVLDYREGKNPKLLGFGPLQNEV